MNLDSTIAKMTNTRLVAKETISRVANGVDASMASKETMANKSISVEHTCRNRCKVENRALQKVSHVHDKGQETCHGTTGQRNGIVQGRHWMHLFVSNQPEYKSPSSIFPRVDRQEWKCTRVAWVDCIWELVRRLVVLRPYYEYCLQLQTFQ